TRRAIQLSKAYCLHRMQSGDRSLCDAFGVHRRVETTRVLRGYIVAHSLRKERADMQTGTCSSVLVLLAASTGFCMAQPGEQVMTGTVTSFDRARSIEIDVKGVAHKYDLSNADIAYSISPEVATGLTVIVTERTDANNKKSVSIVPAPIKPSPA